MDSDDDESRRPLGYQPINVNEYADVGGQYVHVGEIPYDFSLAASRRPEESYPTEEDHQVLSDLYETLREEQPPEFEGEIGISFSDYQRTARFHDDEQQTSTTRAQIIRGKKAKNKDGIKNLLLKLNPISESSSSIIDRIILNYGSKLEFLNYDLIKDMVVDNYNDGNLLKDKQYMTRVRYARLLNYICGSYGLNLPYPNIPVT